MTEFDQRPSDGSQLGSHSTKQRGLFHRLGCWLGIIIWFVLLLLPCLGIALISQGEIAIQLGDVPGQSFRIWLIQNAAERGIGMADPIIHRNDAGVTCLQTDTHFLLWMGKGEPASYCECYSHEGEQWALLSSAQGICKP